LAQAQVWLSFSPIAVVIKINKMCPVSDRTYTDNGQAIQQSSLDRRLVRFFSRALWDYKPVITVLSSVDHVYGLSPSIIENQKLLLR
jgi:hypothetical protein